MMTLSTKPHSQPTAPTARPPLANQSEVRGCLQPAHQSNWYGVAAGLSTTSGFISTHTGLQGFNRYSYCTNNPLKYTDPSGYRQKPDGWNQQWELTPSGGKLLQLTERGAGNHWSDALPGSYSYSWRSGLYLDNRGGVVSYETVFNNFIRPNSISLEAGSFENLRSAIASSTSLGQGLHLYTLDNIFGKTAVVLGNNNFKGLLGSDEAGYTGDNAYGVFYGTSVIFGNYSGGGVNTQSLIANSSVYWTITALSWLWGGVAELNRPDFRVDAASKTAGKFIGKINIGLNAAATIAEGYDLFLNWDQAGRGDVAKFGVDATITSVTLFLYASGVGTPAAMILTGVQFANTIGVFDSVYESFNEPIHGGGGSW